jgi:hypothetical protein
MDARRKTIMEAHPDLCSIKDKTMRDSSQIKPINYPEATAILQDVEAGRIKPIAEIVTRLRDKQVDV